MFNSNIILCFLFFLFLLNASKTSSIFKRSNEIQNINEGFCKETTPCEVECRNGFIENIWKDFAYNTSCDVYSLYIIGYIGTRNQIISKNWFSNINENTLIQSLVIRESSFETIENEAFNSQHFIKTTRLVLDVLKVQHLTKNMFVGLSALTYLRISNIPLKVIDENVLYSMRHTLDQIYIQLMKKPFSLKNLTGSVELLNLRNLYLNYNEFGNLIDENSFTGVKNVSLMNFFNSGIISLHERTFDHVSSNLKVIYFQANKFTTISARTFLFLLKGDLKIHLAYNPWICDCNLLEFKNILQTYPTYFADIPKCASPKEFKDQAIVDTTFCRERINLK